MATFGKTNIGATFNNFPNIGKAVCLFTLAENARPTKFTVYFKGTHASHQGGNSRCLIYSVTAGEPDVLLLVSTIVNVPDGIDQWLDFPITTSADLAPGDYYLGIISANNQIGAMDATGTNRLHTDTDIADPDNPWVTAGTTVSGNQKSIYVTYDALPTFGKSDLNGIESYGNFPNANGNSASQFALPVNGSVTKLSVYYQGTWTTPQHVEGLVRGSIYSSVGAVPGTLLGTTDAVNVPVADGWIDFPFPSPVTLAAGDYFLCVNAATRKVAAMLTAGVNRYCDNTYAGGQDAAWGADGGDASSPWQKLIYATYVATVQDLSVEVFGGFGVRPIPPSSTVLRAMPFETLHLLDTPQTNTAGTVLSRSLSEALHVAEAPAAFVGGATHVASGGNIQAAINAASPGAVITLEAGGTYSSVISITKPLTLTTLGWSHVGRVTMAQKSSMAQIQLAGDNYVIRIDGGAAVNVTLRGIFIAGPGNDIVLCGRADSLQQSLDEMPSNITLDQCIIEGTNGTGRRGIGLHCANGIVTRCHIHKIFRAGTDSTGIGGWNGPGPFTITNNLIQAASEGILFGGSDAQITGTIPENILIDGNTLEKDAAWEGTSVAIKNHIEFKTGRHITITNNILTRTWYSGQGYVLVITPAQYGENPNQQIGDLLFANNVVGPCPGFMNLLGHSQHQDTEPTLETSDIILRDNWIVIDKTDSVGGQGWFMQVAAAPTNLVVEYNTIEMIGGNQWVQGNSNDGDTFPTGHVLRGNIIHNYGLYGTYLSWVDPETGNRGNYLRGERFFDYFPGGICASNALVGAASGIAARLPGNLHGSTTTYPASLIVNGYGTGTLAGYGRRP